MTCHQALSLLEDSVDNELSPSQAADLEEHLKACDSCRQEYQASLQLKQSLKQLQQDARVPDPGEDYWSEVTSLVLAKTVDSTTREPARVVDIRSNADDRRSLVRSLMLFAASLIIMLSAIYLGMQRNQMSASADFGTSPILMTATLSDVMASDNRAIVTREEENQMVRGMLALSTPGPVGRYGGLTELLSDR